jgi:hypothetical protein
MIQDKPYRSVAEDGTITFDGNEYVAMMDELRHFIRELAEGYGDEEIVIAASNVLGREFVLWVLQ